MKERLTPIKAIRSKCLSCCCGQVKEVSTGPKTKEGKAWALDNLKKHKIMATQENASFEATQAQRLANLNIPQHKLVKKSKVLASSLTRYTQARAHVMGYSMRSSFPRRKVQRYVKVTSRRRARHGVLSYLFTKANISPKNFLSLEYGRKG